MLRQAFGARAKHGAQAWNPCTQAKPTGSAKQGCGEPCGKASGKTRGPRGGNEGRQEFEEWQSENIHCGSTMGWLTGQSPAQVREGKSWQQSLCILNTTNPGICSQFTQHGKKPCGQEGSEAPTTLQGQNILQEGWGAARGQCPSRQTPEVRLELFWPLPAAQGQLQQLLPLALGSEHAFQPETWYSLFLPGSNSS